MKKVKALLENHPAFRMLDVGTGVGNFIYLIKSVTDDFTEIVGIDTSQRLVDIAQNNFKEDQRIRFVVMDMNVCDYPDESFDIVSLSNSLHHLSEMKKTLSEMERVVKNDGIILIHEMVSDDLTDKQISHRKLHHFSAEIDRELGDTHRETYSKEQITDLLTKNSTLSIVDSWEVYHGFEEEPTKEEVEGLIQLVDRIVQRVEKSPKFEYFQKKGEEVKDYIRKHGYSSATQMMYVLKK